MFKGEIGTCVNCGKENRLLVVRAGLCKYCNEKRKAAKKAVRLIEKSVSAQPVPKLIKELDDVYSIYIRTKHARPDGEVKCFTCPAVKHWRQMDCGHYESRKHYGTRWEDLNCHPQCKKCNVWSEGNKPEYARALKVTYGDDILDRLEILKHRKMKLERFTLQALIMKYKNLTKSHDTKKPV